MTDYLLDTIWRFEAFITGAQIKPIGPIGHVEVDANTGQVLNSAQTVEAMVERGRQLTPLEISESNKNNHGFHSFHGFFTL